jgi:Uma2 family endonuclease
MLTHEYTPVSEEEYLRLEAQSPVKHEYVNGEMFAMTSGTLRNNAIALNVAAALKSHLRNTPCRVLINDVRVRIEKTHSYYYPDLPVSCAHGAQTMDLSSVTVEDPVLVIEVLLASTEATDRREKLLAYRTLPSTFRIRAHRPRRSPRRNPSPPGRYRMGEDRVLGPGDY